MSMIGIDQYKRFDRYYRTWTRRQRAWRVPLIFALTFGITIALLAVFTGKAFAICSPSSTDVQCPLPAQVQAKMDNGFYVKANGTPFGTVLTTPAADQDVFVNKYVTYYNNHPGKQKGLAQHAINVAASPRTAITMARWNAKYPLHQTVIPAAGMKAAPIPAKLMAKIPRDSRGVIVKKPITNCFAPYTPVCQAKFEWQNLGDATKCGVWHSYPTPGNEQACNRFRNPVKDGVAAITKDQWQAGLAITACAVGSVFAIVAVVGSDGGAAPLISSMAGATGCAVSLWEAVD